MDNVCRHFSKETHMANKQILNLTNRGTIIRSYTMQLLNEMRCLS